MQHFAWADSLWFGEGYDYLGSDPDYWLVETSGLPFGLMGDMMHAGHVWRGMLYGMTTRFRCADPTPLWRLWDAFGIADARMIGYWEAGAPVRSTCDTVLVSAYVRRGNATLLALASWDHEPRTCALTIDYTALGFYHQPPRVRVTLPDLAPFGQPGPRELPLRAADRYHPVLSIEAQQGAIVLVERT